MLHVNYISIQLGKKKKCKFSELTRPTESEWGGGVGQPFVLNLPGDSNVPKFRSFTGPHLCRLLTSLHMNNLFLFPQCHSEPK